MSLEESIYLRELLRRYRERGSSFHEGFELTQLENEVLDDSTWIPCEVMSGMVNDTDELVIHREKHGKEVQQGVVARHGPALPSRKLASGLRLILVEFSCEAASYPSHGSRRNSSAVRADAR